MTTKRTTKQTTGIATVESPKMDEKSKMLIQYEYFLRASPREIILSEARKYGVLTEGLAEMPEYYFNKYVWNRIIRIIIIARGAKENIKTYL